MHERQRFTYEKKLKHFISVCGCRLTYRANPDAHSLCSIKQIKIQFTPGSAADKLTELQIFTNPQQSQH
jgi:hypothetical protein